MSGAEWRAAEMLELFRTMRTPDLVTFRAALRLDAERGDAHTRAFCARRLDAIAVVLRERGEWDGTV